MTSSRVGARLALAGALTAETEDEVVGLVLSKARRRFDGGEPQTRYRFEVTERCSVPLDAAE